MSLYSDRIEEDKENEMFSRRTDNVEDLAKNIFNAKGSAGRNNEGLAKCLIAFDFAMQLLGWDKDEIDAEGNIISPAVNLTKLMTDYQASVDAKYHNDLVKVKTIEELDKRLALRKMESQQNHGGIL